MKKIKITIEAEFNVPDTFYMHEDCFELEGVIFNPTLSFNCIESNPDNPDEPLEYENTLYSIKEFEVVNTGIDTNLTYLESEE
jgi:hypothetical protein